MSTSWRWLVVAGAVAIAAVGDAGGDVEDPAGAVVVAAAVGAGCDRDY